MKDFTPLTFIFFFSSRRRHTRCYRDWSSDVCSSDLTVPLNPRRNTQTAACPRSRQSWLIQHPSNSPCAARSEERRVGKECRSRWAPDHEKKKELVKYWPGWHRRGCAKIHHAAQLQLR